MGKNNSKSRKEKHSLAKVPKYEGTSQIGTGANTTGRFGHGTEHHGTDKPGKYGQGFLNFLGLGKKK
jgi:hypothetical protein